MKNYVKPMVLATEELAEGVYAASGDCYSYTAYITQTPEEGRPNYCIQVDGRHEAADGHHSSERQVKLVFNQPVNYLSSNAYAVSGSGTSTLVFTFEKGNGSYHHNASDNAGLGQLYVESEPGLAIVGIYSTYCNRDCGQH